MSAISNSRSAREKGGALAAKLDASTKVIGAKQRSRKRKWMDVEHVKALVEFRNLKATVEAAIFAANGTLGGLSKDIDHLLRTLSAERLNRTEFGLAVFNIRERCKVELHWMPVRKALSKCIHKSCSTLDEIIKAAVKAQDLGDCRLAALAGEGIDPTEKKYNALIDDLLKTSFYGTFPEARKVVQLAIVRFRDERKRVAGERRNANLAAKKNQVSRMRRMLKDRLRHVKSRKKNEIGTEIFREFADAFEAEFPDFKIELAQETRKAEITLIQNTRNAKRPRTTSQDNQTLTAILEPAVNPIAAAL